MVGARDHLHFVPERAVIGKGIDAQLGCPAARGVQDFFHDGFVLSVFFLQFRLLDGSVNRARRRAKTEINRKAPALTRPNYRPWQRRRLYLLKTSSAL